MLGPQGEIVGACGGTDFDKDLAMVAKMNKLFAFGGAEYIIPVEPRPEPGPSVEAILGRYRGPPSRTGRIGAFA